MIRSTFLLALIASAAQAVHLKINSEADTDAATGEPEVLDSLVEGPNDGFPTDACDANIPADFDDAVCFDGMWIEFAWLDDPTFW